MGNKINYLRSSKNERKNKDNNEDLSKQYEKIFKLRQPCTRYVAEHPKLNITKHFLIQLESVLDEIPSVISGDLIGAEIDESICGFKSCQKNEVEQFMDIGKSYISKVILLNVDNRWKNNKNFSNENKDKILCVWYLQRENINFPNVQKKLGGIYNLHYLQIVNDKTIFITFKLIILSKRHPKSFLISPDCNYLLIFGEGCNFFKLPDIYNDIIKNKLFTIKEIECYYKCNMENKNNLFLFQTYPTISMAHFIKDDLLICVDHYYSDVGLVPSDQSLYLLDLKTTTRQNNKKRLIKCCDNSDIFGNQEQYITSGQGLIAFSCGPHTKYAPNHLIKDKSISPKNHLWIYKIDDNHKTKVIGHNYSLQFRIKSDWRGIQQNNENSQIIKREFDGINKGKYWLIVFANNHCKIDNINTNISKGDILIFDIPSCILIWIIPNSRFKLKISNRSYFSAFRYCIKIYVCSYGIVLMRKGSRNYGSNNTREEADFALHPVPFWDHEQLTKLLQPHVEFIYPLIDIILSYIVNPSLNETKVLSNLRFIQSNCLAVSDGFGSFIVMSSYWNRKQLKRIRKTVSDNNMLNGIDLYKKYENDPNIKIKYNHVLFKVSWAQLMEFHHEPNPNQSQFDQESINFVDENGSFLNFCHQFFSQ